MSNAISTLEVPLDSLRAAQLAAPFASRLELCDDLASEGWTPTGEFVKAVRAFTDVSLVVMIRPRFADSPRALTVGAFFATERVMTASKKEIEMAARAGANSVAIGLLTADGDVDLIACAELAKFARAAALDVAFLRTFDLIADRERAMRDITDLAVLRVVTAGVLGWNSAVDSISRRLDVLAQDVRNAHACAPPGRAAVEVVACGGVRTENVREFLGVSPHLHASCRRLGEFSGEEVESLYERMIMTRNARSAR